MKNCLCCKHAKNMGKLIGCAMNRRIVIRPDEFKPCCDENISGEELFNRIFKGAAKMEVNRG